MSAHRTILTTCTRDCPDACGIKAFITGGRLVGLSGATEHGITHSFLCRKAMSFIQRVYSLDRILTPRVKIEGSWQEASWDSVLNLIANKIKDIVGKYGSNAILHYQGAGSLGALKMLNKRFFNLLGGVTEANGSLCGGAGIAGQTMDFGFRTAHDPMDLLNSKLIILWGRNPSDTNIHLIPILKEARANRANIVLIDPISTGTSRFCDLHIKPNPGMDGYLALAVSKLILDSGRVNTEFVGQYSENFDMYHQMVDGFSLDFLSNVSGVSVPDIKILADLYSERKPAAIVCGWGLQRYQWGAETFRLIDALAAITGNIGIAGGGVSHGRDEYYYFNESVKGKEFAKNMRYIPKPLLGKSIKELNNSPIKMAFVNGANPLNQSPDTNSVKEAFGMIDFVVVFEQFMTDTAEAADVVLPVTNFLEETDVAGSYWHNYIGLVKPAITPLGLARSDLNIYQELADRLGFGTEMEGSEEYWINQIIEPLKSKGITFEGLMEKPMRVPDAPMVPFADRVFKTESGKFNFITSFSTRAIDTEDYPLILLSTHSKQWIHSQVLPAEYDAPLKAKVNPVTATAYGVIDGGNARIVSPLGKVAVVIEHSMDIKENVVHVEQGYWGKFGLSSNHLIPSIMSREGKNACYYQTAVRLEKG